MFRLHRNRHAKSGEKFDFKFSNFKATQVPKGWDKLFVSVISEQTGKTIIRSSKASVRNGSCQWTESLSDSIWVSQDEVSKEFEDCNFKLVVAMGSARSNILGETMVNMTNYIDSKSSSTVSLPLKKCNHGTTLQMKIQCLASISKVRSGEFKHTDSPKQDLKKEGHDSDSCSDITDSQLSRSIGSSSGADLYSSLHSGEASSKATSFSASYSQLSNSSSEVYESVENDAAKNNYSDIQRQDSVSSQNSAPCLSPNSVITGSAEATAIEELRAEARMWERNSHKLMADLDQLKKEFSDQSENQESLHAALSAATAECDGLRKELEQLKLVTEKSTQRQTSIEDLSYQDGEPHILKDELKFQKETNADLALQLKRSQESNIELVSVLQELEATTEKQKLELEELLARHQKDDDIENINKENKKLVLQLEHVKESEKNLQLKVGVLERNLEEAKLDLQKSEVSNKKFPQDTERQYDSLLNSEENVGSLHYVNINLVKEIEMLKEKVQELEKDCNELTDENIDLLYKLKQANSDSKGGSLALNSTGDSMKFELEIKVEELSRELTEKKLEIEKLESSILSKDDEIKILEGLHKKLQAKYSDLQKEKNQIEEKMEVILGESDSSSKCLNGLRNEVKALSNSVDLHVSANKILESKYSELQFKKQELDLHVSQIEQERIRLSESVSVLESQLKYMMGEKQSICLELEDSKSHAVGLQDEFDRLRLEIETENVDLKQMLDDLQNQCAKAQDQCEYLQREKTKLEAAAEHLVEERNLVQKSNGELKNKNFELHEGYFRLESKVKESLERSAQYFRRIDDFEDYLSLELDDFASKERFLSSELDSIVEDNIKYKEKLAMLESLYNEIYLEKATVAQELHGSVVHRTKQVSAAKKDFNIMRMESDENLTALISELSVSKQNQETLIADNEKLLKQLENYKSLEVELKNSVNDLELKLYVSEKERRQNEKQLTNLKVQLQKTAHFQDEVFASSNKLEQKTVAELEDSKQSGIALEEKLLRLGSGSVMEETSFPGIDDLRNELCEIKRMNSTYQQKLKILEEEKDGCLKRSQSLEAELKHLKEEKQIQRESSSVRIHSLSKTNDKNRPSKDMKPLKNDAVKTVGQNHSGKKKPKDLSSDQSQSQIKSRQDDSGCDIDDEGPHVPEAKSISRIQMLEKELAEALEANKKYEDQLSRLVSDTQNNKENSPISTVEGDVVKTKEGYESLNSALEAELKDIRERYFHISLKYAEVEHQREELVMKLKAAKNSGRRWFS
ncbi:sporulation-specific protein 15-like isoform X3 [Cucumis melo]|uniref:Sporulation-specific protein 15-like isoform X3 n=1 Tax=Cucumis melo TaxID=3656 RepID=A0ABM3KQQ4_CUCME|nr:sporulation-specific protein 15-like isoform X3 [Cucumis melo]